MMISVIIPVYNSTVTIFKCLKALKNQTLKPDEVIIVDDGSSDNLEYKINNTNLSFMPKNLILLKQRHKGVSQARNLGAKKASGDILAFIDSDCIPAKNWLKNIYSALSDSEIGAVGGGYCSGIDNSFWQKFSNDELFFRRRKRGNFVTTLLSNNMGCYKKYFWEAGGFPKQFPVCEDMFLAYQISKKYKLRWLQNNGVKHHYKKNLRDFLKHQYFFGKESTFFFLNNPEILQSDNHQGKQLHLAIVTSFLGLISLFLFFISAVFSISYFKEITLFFTISFLFLHFLLYSEFLLYLKKKKYSVLDITRAYYVSFLRDIVAAFSFFTGVALYFRAKWFYNR